MASQLHRETQPNGAHLYIWDGEPVDFDEVLEGLGLQDAKDGTRAAADRRIEDAVSAGQVDLDEATHADVQEHLLGVKVWSFEENPVPMHELEGYWIERSKAAAWKHTPIRVIESSAEMVFVAGEWNDEAWILSE